MISTKVIVWSGFEKLSPDIYILPLSWRSRQNNKIMPSHWPEGSRIGLRPKAEGQYGGNTSTTN